jgi:sec-independent protein translocase protein TatB
MLDIGVSKLAIIGAIALVVIGPERLPKLARMAGNLLGRARSYMAEVKAEVNRSMELDELKKMKDSMESAARDVEQSIQTSSAELEKNWSEATDMAAQPELETSSPRVPEYQHPRKHWRTKKAAVPNWYKARAGVRTKALSGAARVARFRPPKIH